jgi:hypothetical protein
MKVFIEVSSDKFMNTASYQRFFQFCGNFEYRIVTSGTLLSWEGKRFHCNLEKRTLYFPLIIIISSQGAVTYVYILSALDFLNMNFKCAS